MIVQLIYAMGVFLYLNGLSFCGKFNDSMLENSTILIRSKNSRSIQAPSNSSE